MLQDHGAGISLRLANATRLESEVSGLGVDLGVWWIGS